MCVVYTSKIHHTSININHMHTSPGDHLRRDFGALEHHVDLHLTVKGLGSLGVLYGKNRGNSEENYGKLWKNPGNDGNVGRTWRHGGNKWEKWRTTEPINNLTLEFEHDLRMSETYLGPHQTFQDQLVHAGRCQSC